MNTLGEVINREELFDHIPETMPATSILVIDHDVQLREQLQRELEGAGFVVHLAAGEQPALRQLAQHPCDLAILNDALPGNTSESIVNHLKALAPRLDIILLADHTTRLFTLEMIRHSLYTYFTKPLDLGELKRTLVHRVQERQQNQPVDMDALPGPVPVDGSLMPVVAPPKEVPSISAPALRVSRPRAEHGPGEGACFIGDSKSIKYVREQVLNIAPTAMTVLIHGESGVGKGAVARLIHTQSGRAQHDNFIPINCPAIPESLMESELFGHESGAFTGAEGAKPGRLELANGGTAFLDEIGEIPLTMQVKLLHVIENKEIYHLGGAQTDQDRRALSGGHQRSLGADDQHRSFPRRPVLSAR